MTPEEAVRKFFDCYTNGRPEDFDDCVAPDYVDYGHTPPGVGPARRATTMRTRSSSPAGCSGQRGTR